MIEVRKAVGSDLAFVKRCATAAYAKYVKRIGRKPAPMITDFKTRIRQGYVEIATMNGRPAGYIISYLDGEALHVENVAVLPEHQGQGIGRALLRSAESAAKSGGMQSIELYTNEKMHENLALYARLWFAETGRRREQGFNRVYFRKRI